MRDLRTRTNARFDLPSPPRKRWGTFGMHESEARNVPHRLRGGLASVGRGWISSRHPLPHGWGSVSFFRTLTVREGMMRMGESRLLRARLDAGGWRRGE